MGLDVCLLKILRVEEKNLREDEDNTLVLSQYPELEPFSHLALEKQNEYYDLETALKEKHFDPKDLSCFSQEYGEDVIFRFHDSEKNIIEIINPSTFKRKEKVLVYEEVGYQRKGANKQFYEEDIWSSPCILKKETLLEHWDKYFSAEPEYRQSFKENIVDKFVEGETVLVYW